MFRDLGSDRTIAEAFRQHSSLKKVNNDRKRSISNTWRYTAVTWHWHSRAEAWDIQQRKEAQKQEMERQREVDQEWKRRQLQHRDDMWDFRNKLLAIAKDMMQSSLYTKVIEQDEQGRQVIKLIPAKWTFGDIPKLVKLADELGREATGANVDHLALVHELRQVGWIDDQASDEIAEKLREAIEHSRKAIAQSAAEMLLEDLVP